MNKTDIKIITEIMLTADGGCSGCVTKLLRKLGKEYPSFQNDIIETLKLDTDSYPNDQVLENLTEDGFEE